MSAKLRGAGPRKMLLVVGIVFLGATAWIATFAVSVSVSRRETTPQSVAARSAG